MPYCGYGAACVLAVKLEGIAFCIFLKEEIAYESKRENEKTA